MMSSAPNLLSRRRLLIGLGLSLPASAALAFDERPMTVPQAAAHAAGCGGPTAHASLIAEVEKSLGTQLTEDEKRMILVRMSCPVCGCPLAS